MTKYGAIREHISKFKRALISLKKGRKNTKFLGFLKFFFKLFFKINTDKSL